MECAGNGRALLEPRPLSQPWLTEAVGTARWRGPRLSEVLARAEPAAGAVEAVFAGLDRGVEAEAEQRYERSLPLAEATGGEAILAYAMNGQPLPPQHGYPLRLLVPGWYGMTNVKWLGSITLVERPFEGYQQARAYRLRRDEEEPGAPLSRMAVRALMVPPGIPEFFTRERLVRLGTVELEGRAWSGWAPVTRVEVSTDGGETWAPAALAEDVDSPWAWRRWTYAWEASAPGAHLLCCRASDAAGNVQPLEPTWNLGGYANNAVQRVPATVVEAG
jgi:DMSO/TMAO reductase YedYZ molybdopterin-dependent catalytic subunit